MAPFRRDCNTHEIKHNPQSFQITRPHLQRRSNVLDCARVTPMGELLRLKLKQFHPVSSLLFRPQRLYHAKPNEMRFGRRAGSRRGCFFYRVSTDFIRIII